MSKARPLVLLSPLDWGLGHATRCIPIIREFLRQDAQVILGTTGAAHQLLALEFPQVEQVECISYNIRYPSHGAWMPFWLLGKGISLTRTIHREQQWCEQLCKKRGIDIVVSDNRFGCYSSLTHNIYMTHQLRIAFPFWCSKLEPLGTAWHRSQYAKFQSLWIPDVETSPGLAGRLSHLETTSFLLPQPQYLGPLSRFATSKTYSSTADVAWLAICSGPEPHRSQFESECRTFLSQARQHLGPTARLVLLQGLPGAKAIGHNDFEVYSHLATEPLQQLIASTKYVVSRSGYSTLMDLVQVHSGAKAVFVPTPGQTEQQYLARLYNKMGYALHMVPGSLDYEQVNSDIEHTALPAPVASTLSLAVTNALRSIP